MEKGSQFYKAKWEGEWAVKREFPDATIIRPADAYGLQDRFLGVYGSRWRQHFGLIFFNISFTIDMLFFFNLIKFTQRRSFI